MILRKGHFNHAEAYCLMIYEGTDIDGKKHRETLWNARDGVTPFSITDRALSYEMQHVDFFRDRCEPAWASNGLKVGDRVFVDMTLDQAREVAVARIAHIKQVAIANEMSVPEDFESAEKIDDVARKFFGDGGNPHVVVVDEALLEKLRRPSSEDITVTFKTDGPPKAKVSYDRDSFLGITQAKLKEVVTSDPAIRFGEPCLTGTRIPITTVVSRALLGDPVSDISEDFNLSPETVTKAIRWAIDELTKATP